MDDLHPPSAPLFVGAALAHIRISLYLSQQALAEQIGVSASTLAKIERGASLLDLATLEALATTTNTHLDYLVGRLAVFDAADAGAILRAQAPQPHGAYCVFAIRFAPGLVTVQVSLTAQQLLLFSAVLRDVIPAVTDLWHELEPQLADEQPRTRADVLADRRWRDRVTNAFCAALKDVSDIDIARKTALSPQTIAKARSGASIPGYGTLARIVDAYPHLTLEHLVGRDREPSAKILRVAIASRTGKIVCNLVARNGVSRSREAREITDALRFARANAEQFERFRASEPRGKLKREGAGWKIVDG